MPDQQHIEILDHGVPTWNEWRKANRTIQANLDHANLQGKFLHDANFYKVNLQNADLSGAHLLGANFNGADLRGARLIGTDLTQADFRFANLEGADLSVAHCHETNFNNAFLHGAKLIHTVLIRTLLDEADLSEATLDHCNVYGVAAWKLNLDGATQTNLLITAPGEPAITLDNIEIAQFIYLMLHNQKIRDIIDVVTSKVVLILGRFTPERKRVLDALREELRTHNYVPVIFDFEGSHSLDFTETVTLLARMARFIVADLTEPSSIPQELQAIIPHVAVPVKPLIAQDAQPFAMFADYRKYMWALPPYRYASLEDLLAALDDEVIAPAEAKVIEVQTLKQPGTSTI